MLLVPGEGDAGPHGGPAGDLYVRVSVKNQQAATPFNEREHQLLERMKQLAVHDSPSVRAYFALVAMMWAESYCNGGGVDSTTSRNDHTTSCV